MKQRFKLNISKEDAAASLFYAYEANVFLRNSNYEKNKDIWEICKKISKWLVEGEKDGLLLLGNPGNGKTTMAKSICDIISLLNSSPYDNERIGVFRISALHLEKMIVEEPLRFNSIKNCKMLYIDDMGMESDFIKSFGNNLEPISEIIYHRYDNKLFTIASSNLTDKEFKEKYGDRIHDRMKEMFDRIIFTNQSFRK